MSESKAKELFYGLDLYSANPTWRVNKGFSLNTWKSLLGTFVIVLTSFGLSY